MRLILNNFRKYEFYRKNLYKYASKIAFNYLTEKKFKKFLKTILVPIDYVRVVELPLALSLIELKPGEKLLDVAGPKIMSFYLAKIGGIVNVIDILDNEIQFCKFHAKKDKGINSRLVSTLGDVRNLNFSNKEFDIVYSISVLEHIYPEKDGGTIAIKEMARVLKPGGRMIFTVPYAKKARTEYKMGTVYERQADKSKKIFFQRWYDRTSLQDQLIKPSGLKTKAIYYIGEKVFINNPEKRLFMYINNGSRTDLIFGRFYNFIASQCLEISDREETLEKPYIVCCCLVRED